MIEYLHYFQNDFMFYLYQYLDRYPLIFPLGIIGIWRWSVWMIKEIIGMHYHPKTKEYKASVSIITPVYNEDPKLFRQALESWKENNPSEIIAIIDHTDKACIDVFKAFSKDFKKAVMVITEVPGKRPALAEGIKKAKSEILALVDSDTLWNEKVVRNGLPPFHDPKVAGVATYQSVLNPKTFAQKIFDIQLDLRYLTEYPFLAAAGNALVCLSGRTAFYRRDVILPMVRKLTHETFMGRPVISGDDKCLTYLVLSAGWKVAYQSTSHVYTPGMKDFKSYLKQRLRWSRNALRADSKALLSGWPLHHKALLFFQIDKMLQAFLVVLSPVFFLVALYYRIWWAALVIFCWWFISRTVKMYPHLHRKPGDIIYVPGFVYCSFLLGVLKIYAMFTLNTQGWITRWDKSRLNQIRFVHKLPPYFATALVIVGLFFAVSYYKTHAYIIPHEQKDKLLRFVLREVESVTSNVLGESTFKAPELMARRHVVVKGDTPEKIAKAYDTTVQRLYYANFQKMIPSRVVPGTTLVIPGKDMKLEHPVDANEGRFIPEKLTVTFDKGSNTLLVSGRGTVISLSDIIKNGGEKYIKQTGPKDYLLTTSLLIFKGVTLNLDSREVEWLKLQSNKNSYVALRAWNGDININGVKITSWDTTTNDYDKNIEDGRSFVFVKDNSRMDINNSEIAYLGFATSPDFAVSPYGISWKLSSLHLKSEMLTGIVTNSKFHNNYFGAYTYGATGMLWDGNEFYDNVRYGLDPHDDSDGFLVQNNTAYGNGTHGIIFSKRCMYNTIKNNISFNNRLHGIMLHEKSDYNIVEGNTVYGNTSGIALWHSSNNIVQNNSFDKNKHGIRANQSSVGNVISSNKITRSISYGIYMYDKANDNLVENNILNNNNIAIYVKADGNRIASNVLQDNRVGIYFLDTAKNNVLAKNTISNSKLYGVYSKVSQDVSNVLGANTLTKNRKDLTAH